MENSVTIAVLQEIMGPLTILVLLLAVGWIGRCWLRAGRSSHLARDNAQLRDELGTVKDRLATLERIATDRPARLVSEIDALR